MIMSNAKLKKLIAVARGDAAADLILAGGRVVNTFTGEVERANAAISGGKIAGLGDYTWARRVIDLDGRYLAPGLIDGHFHLESSNLEVGEFARAVVPLGVLGGVTDLHEIANVCGVAGLRRVLREARNLPYDLFVLAPSCVPATALETNGASLGLKEVRRILGFQGVIGLGEFMDFPAVIQGGDRALELLETAGDVAKEGHAPGLSGRDLNAYLAPLIGSDHETTTCREGLEKLRRGMFLMIREGTTEQNLEELLPLVNDQTYHRCMLVVDDLSAGDIYRHGGLDAVVRKAIGLGLDPVRAIQMATIVPAQYFHLKGLGAIAPGHWANMVVFEDLSDFTAGLVFYRGELVAKNGRSLLKPPGNGKPTVDTFNIRPFAVEDLALRAPEIADTRTAKLPVIEVVPGQPATKRREFEVRLQNGVVHGDLNRDLLKLVVVERHRATGNIGKSLVRGFGLKKGALASSMAHDSHNVVAVGVADADIYAGVKEIEANHGGMVVVEDGRVTASLPLPVAGLLCQLNLEQAALKLEALDRAAANLGCPLKSPFSVLSFMALPVIPELKLTDRGLAALTQGVLKPV